MRYLEDFGSCSNIVSGTGRVPKIHIWMILYNIMDVRDRFVSRLMPFSGN